MYFDDRFSVYSLSWYILKSYGLTVNTILKRHNRSVFSTQATHHVGQQVERLYWNSIDPESNEENLQAPVIDKVSDLTNSKFVVSLFAYYSSRGLTYVNSNISRLPEQWPDEDASDENQARLD